MEIVNKDKDNNNDDALKSAAELAQDAGNDVEADEAIKESLVMTPLEEALANSRQALQVAEIAIQSASQMTTHILAMEELLLSKGVLTVKEFKAQLDHLNMQAKELSNKEVENIMKKTGGLSPDDMPESN